MLFHVFLQCNFARIDFFAVCARELFFNVMRTLTVVVHVCKRNKLLVTLIAFERFGSTFITKQMIFAIIPTFETFLANRALIARCSVSLFGGGDDMWCILNDLCSQCRVNTTLFTTISCINRSAVAWWWFSWNTITHSILIDCFSCAYWTPIFFLNETFPTLLMSADLNNYSIIIRLAEISMTNTALRLCISWTHFLFNKTPFY